MSAFIAAYLLLACGLAEAAPIVTPTVQFRVAARVPLDDTPAALTVFDLDGDGDLDVAVVNFDTGAVNVLLNDGVGGLTRIPDSVTGGHPRSIAAGRLDGDAIPDLVTTEFESDNMWFLAGRGDGTFAAPKLITGGFHDPLAVLAVDMNGDGKLDLVQSIFGELGGRVNVFYGNGDGTFAAPVGGRTGGGNNSVAVADFNNDGRLDLVAPDYFVGTVSVVLARSDGTFARGVASPVGNSPAAVAAGLIDADEFADVVVANQGSDAMSFSRGRSDGSGTFDDPQFFPVGHGPFGIALADLNGDGRPDAVVSNSLSSSVSVLLGTGTGDFAPARHFIADTSPVQPVVADMDHDGFPDVVTVNKAAGGASVTVLSGRGTALAAIEHLSSTTAAGAVAVADVDNDGLPDVAATFAADAMVGVYFARPSGGFASLPAAPFTLRLDPQGQPTNAVFADVNSDGWPDLVTANQTGANLSVLLNRHGTFDAAIALNVGGAPAAVVAADFDRNGTLDLAAAVPSTNQVMVMHGNGDASFAAALPIATPGNPGPLASGDFNHDGRPDLAVGTRDTGSVTILLGNASGSFDNSVVAVGSQPSGIAVLDANGDGTDDFAVSLVNGTVRVFISDGLGGFSPGLTLRAGDAPSAIAARDVTGDQLPDLIVSNMGANSVSVFANLGGGAFAAPVNLTVTPQPLGVASGDFDGNGSYDLVASGSHPAVASNLAVTNVHRGDANDDGRLSAADLVTFAGTTTPAGVRVEQAASAALDANGDAVVNRQDLLAAAGRIFGRASQSP